MSRVEIASMPWGTVQDRSGNALASTSVTITNTDGSPATHWSAATGGSSATTSLTTDVNGTLPRFIDAGQYLIDVPSLSITGRQVDAVSGESPVTGSILQASGGADPTQSNFLYYPPSTTLVRLGSAGEYNDSTSGNLLQVAAYARNSGDRATVGLWSSVQGEHSFGANPGAVTLGKGTAIGIEVDVGNFIPITTTTVGSHVLPAATINVASTAGIFNSGTFQVTSGAGTQTITFTGITATSFTGCTGGTGTVSAGATVTPQTQGTPIAHGILIASKQNGGPANPSGVGLYLAGAAGGEFGIGILLRSSGSGNNVVRSDGTLIKADGTPTYALGIEMRGPLFTTAAFRADINSGSTTASRGVVLRAAGGFANAGSAIQITGDGSSSVNAGIEFATSGVTGALISAIGGIAVSRGIDFNGAVFSADAIRLPDGGHIALGTSTGTQIGRSATQKMSFYGGTPTVRQSIAAAATDAATTQTLANSIRTILVNLNLAA